MKIDEAIAILKRHNEWRRGADIPMEEPKVIGEAIDCVVEYYDNSFIPVAEAYEKGFVQGKAANPWHKIADDGLPKKNGCYFAIFKRKNGGMIIDVFNFIDGYFIDWRAAEGQYTYWMEIPEIPEEK